MAVVMMMEVLLESGGGECRAVLVKRGRVVGRRRPAGSGIDCDFGVIFTYPIKLHCIDGGRLKVMNWKPYIFKTSSE